MFTNYCINSIIFMTIFSNTCPSQEVHVSLLAFFFFLTCLGDSQLSSDFAKRKPKNQHNYSVRSEKVYKELTLKILDSTPHIFY